MSVAAERSHSPTHFRQKRSFEPAESSEHHPHSSEHHTKRPRQHHRATANREGRSEAHHASAARASTLLALKGLFPGMEEQVCYRNLSILNCVQLQGTGLAAGFELICGRYCCQTG